jgi:hypothetical protein
MMAAWQGWTPASRWRIARPAKRARHPGNHWMKTGRAARVLLFSERRGGQREYVEPHAAWTTNQVLGKLTPWV